MDKKIVRVGSRGRIVIPKKFRDELKLQEQVLVILDDSKRELRIKPSLYKQMKLHELK
jgi:AbrB family looped-hinge helix DNA binding protein